MAFIKTFIPLVLVWLISLPLYAAPTLTLTYSGDSSKPVKKAKISMTDSDGTTILFTDGNGQVTLPTTSNTYTLAASLAETGEDPVDLLDAIWILQHSGELRTLTAEQFQAADVDGDGEVDLLDAIWILQHSGELRTLDPSLVFLDANTGNLLSETTFSPGDTPSIMVIRTGDVDQSFEPVKFWFQRGLDINGKPLDIINYEDNNYEEKFGTSIAMTSDTNKIIIGAPDANVVIVREFTSDIESLRAGKARVFKWDGGAWTQYGQDIFNDESRDCLNGWGSDKYDTGSGYGTSVAITDAGDNVLLGAPGHATHNFIFRNPCLSNGAAQVFRWESQGDQPGWKKSYFLTQDRGSGTNSPNTFVGGQGSQVAISNDGNRVVTGGIGSKFSLSSNFIKITNGEETVLSHLAVWSEDPSTYPEADIDVFDRGKQLIHYVPSGYSGCLHTLCENIPSSWIMFRLCAQTPHWNYDNLGSCDWSSWMRDAEPLIFEGFERIVDASMAMSVTPSSLDGCTSCLDHVVNYKRIAVLIQKHTNPSQQAHVRVYDWSPADPGTDDEWEQLGSNIEFPSGYNIGSVKLSSDGNTVAITANAIGQTSGPGHVQIYNWNSTEWVVQGSYIDGKTGDRVLQSLALSADGKTVAFGVPEAGHGVVRIYDFK